ncbi:peroxidase-like protein 3 [Mizuhopecten yessoensis]|uniref:peroxidase-like protein 3 n=1 Tax=Mizuhopecten yessoensis TaxID=6573 RepID=UPI000B4584A1|nr:peroxidase-like protein 3 [Mizuhopecten yessoensis]
MNIVQAVNKSLHESITGCCAITDELIRNERIQCNTIEIDPATDPDYSHTCMGLRRSLPARGEHICEAGVREQLNDITSYVDGSQIYGSTEEVAKSLRTFKNGKLLVADSDLLPKNSDTACVLDDPDKNHCFLAGDVRVNENPQLMALHTAFVRYHNALCDRLVFQGLSIDEDIYQIARKIIGAILQNTLYGQWLPSVIGADLMDKEGLTVGSTFNYNDTIDATILNAFAGAAFRYGHTLVHGTITTVDDNFGRKNEVPLKDSFFNTSLAFNSIADIARTMSLYQCKVSDAFLVDDLKTHLFETATSHGMDLTALNIQRGRDHGLPGYIAFRDWIGLSVPKDFSELSDHTLEAQAKLASAYADVRDIDLFPGAMLETNVDGAHIGPTFSAILAEQFKRLKFGDRFYFETTGDQGFLPAQLDNIKKVSFAKIMCEAFGLEVIQDNVFSLPKVEDLKRCDSYTDIDVSLFKDI